MVLKIKDDKNLFSDSHWNEEPINFAYFLLAPIILDTYNLDSSLKDSKWQEEDKIAHDWLT